jgi:aryl-alcohol dehydrogenase-like predicted oxidoreductase
MNHSPLGSSGLQVSRLCLGTMTFGVQCDEPSSRAILDTAVEAGISFLDTADVYPIGGDSSTTGLTEEIVGRWMRGRRDEVIIATKGFNPTGPRPWDRGNSRKHLLSAIDESLRRLQTDHVDLYQLHQDDRATPLDETLAALDHIVSSGRARYVGCSNFAAYRTALALGRSEAGGVVRFVSHQPRYNLISRGIERELLPLAAETGLGVIPYNPMAGGLLTGKHRRDTPPEEGTRFAIVGTGGPQYRKRYWHDRSFDVVDSLRPLADEAGISMATMAVAWVMAQPTVSSVIVGASRPEQLDDAVAAEMAPLDDELLRQLDELTLEFRTAPETDP